MLARLNRPAAILFALLLAAVAVWCATTRPPPIKVAKKGGYTDVRLYREITVQVAHGVPYHQAAANLQRLHHYPLRPFFTMRPPTLVEAAAWFGWKGVQSICMGLLAVGVFVWIICLEGQVHWYERVAIGGAVAFGGGAVLQPTLLALHEYPAGLCIGVAVAGMLGWPRKWWAVALPVALGLALRELVLPVALLALGFAGVERRWKEVAGWVAVLAGFAVFMAIHASQAAAVVRPGDITSQGWHEMLGFSGFLKAVIFTSGLQTLPLGLALLVAMLPMVGWLALGGRGGLFVQILVAGYAVMISAFSRADTFYWGAIMLPWYFAGWALLPRALWQLYGAIRGHGTPAPFATPVSSTP